MARDRSMILDTCALLWLAAGGKSLSAAALKKIEESPEVYVSAISGYEIAIKVAKGKLRLPDPPKEWFAGVIKHHGLTVLPLELEFCIGAAELPAIHDDPFDRFVIATAKSLKLAVVTRDERVAEYGVRVIS